MVSPRIVSIDTERPDQRVLQHCAEILRNGKLIVAPTETRYGMLTNARSRSALERLYEVKGRPSAMPTSLFVRSFDEISATALVTRLAERIIHRFLPGPVTVVLEATSLREPYVVVEGKVGLRWSPSPVIDGLVASAGFPLTATSANRSGDLELTTITEIAATFAESVDLYLDGGPLAGVTSTVVDCSGSTVRILREGAIPAERIIDSVKDLIST